MAKLFPWDPWLELQTMKEDMTRMMEDSTCPSPFLPGTSRVAQFRPVADVIESSDAFVLLIELPGLERDDVALEISENELVVYGERKMLDIAGAAFQILERSYGCFARRFMLPMRIDADRVRASMKEGLLTVSIAKKNLEPVQKRVSILVED